MIRKRHAQEKAKLKKLFKNTDGRYPQPVYYDEEKGYYKKERTRNRAHNFYDRNNNRKLRRFKGDIKDGGSYKKFYDGFWH